MRSKIIAQPEINFDPPTLKITQDFHAKYERISDLLDANPAILDLAIDCRCSLPIAGSLTHRRSANSAVPMTLRQSIARSRLRLSATKAWGWIIVLSTPSAPSASGRKEPGPSAALDG